MSLLGEEDWARGVAIQPNGKIVVGGYAYRNGMADFALARYRAGGRLDRSFGSLGLWRTDFGAGKNDYAFDLGLQADGRILAAGWVTSSAGHHAGVARYLAAQLSRVRRWSDRIEARRLPDTLRGDASGMFERVGLRNLGVRGAPHRGPARAKAS